MLFDNQEKGAAAEIQFIDFDADFSQKEAAIILENKLKLEREQEREQQYNRPQHSSGDMLDGIFDAAANALEKMIKAAIEEMKKAQDAKEREDFLKEIQDEMNKYITESKTVGELEARAAEAKKLFEMLDKHYAYMKGDTAAERVWLNQNAEINKKIIDACKQIKDKSQAVNFTDRESLKADLTRIYRRENIVEIKATTAELKKQVSAATDEMREKSQAATTKMKELYERSTDYEKHSRRNPGLYYYNEPPNAFNGEGIPKESETGKAITEEIRTRNDMEKGISESREILSALEKIEPEREHTFHIKKGEDVLEKIREQTTELAQDLKHEQDRCVAMDM